MGDLHVTSPRLNGAAYGENRLCSSPPSPPLPPSNPDLSSVSVEARSAAEKTTHEILSRIQPTLSADQRRREVVDYVQRLIKNCIGWEVFPYGSVPLKTYLPDGDIDLTALCYQNIEDVVVSDVHAVLRGEENRETSEYEVKDVRFIDAEVKLVKCIVQNIVVDISFNQLGGLCTLCFLERVDCLVGKNHLFKRSIILIKAWCYYESRILGAHHGLISTYALETLVLYIFHHFHVSLDGPLAVLYRFLDYFSKFDWENYCVSLKGPVSKSSLPDIVAELQGNGGNDLLLTEEFLRNCVELFSVPSKGPEQNLRSFTQKHLNIIDPLKDNNNLGRSVNRANFYRIRSAFKYGARKLGWILMLPEDRITDELNKFFANTLDRHGSTQWGDMQTPSLACSSRGLNFLSSSSDTGLCSDLSSAFKKDRISGNQLNFDISNESDRYSLTDISSWEAPLFDSAGDRTGVLGDNIGADAKNIATSEVLGVKSTNGSSYCSNLSSHSSENTRHLMQFNFALPRENGKAEDRISCRETAVNSVMDEEKDEQVMISHSLGSHIDNISIIESDQYTSVSGSSEASKFLLDLTGDYDSHFRNLQYGQSSYSYAIPPSVPPPVVPSPPRSPKLQNMNPWETAHQSLQINHNVHPQTNSNGVVGQRVYLVNHPTLPIASFGPEEKRKTRGTGAYFPNMASRPFRDRPSPGRGRSQAPGNYRQLFQHTRNNGLASAIQEVNVSVEGSSEHAFEGYPVLGNAKPRLSETHFSQPSTRGSHHANGFPISSEKPESGLVSPKLRGPLKNEVSSPLESNVSSSKGSVPSPRVLAEEGSNSLSEVNGKRIEVQAYHLKNEDDFPPLSH
ncbi:hypothetical protein L6164_028455 [Bauhinia variegata]|uniref:Uncharacterized protein n=1 Tax=Bauhinia variegata TaxID=167791 RepID=A0ACB9L5M5_BAUVA|nr:hypothetical protein L6164_028455 [Bauhinia variegata]